jgi:carbon-monoxide dehydrogenase medium subunit
MKAAAFDFVQPSSIDEACEHLARVSDDPQIIAGGQSLMPMMAMRLVRPGLIVDINKIEALSGIAERDDGVTIGACTRQADAEASPIVRTQLPLLKKALRFVGHDQTRNRGTIGGSLAHADPSAEICLTAIALGANITLTSAKGKRDLTAAEFILGPMTTAIEDDEILTAVSLSVWTGEDRIGAGFQEVSSRQSDFAIVAAAAQISIDADGTCRRAVIAVANATPAPIRLTALEDGLVGHEPTAAIIDPHLESLNTVLEPEADLHASGTARIHIAKSLTRRAILEAAEDAKAND